MNTNNKSLQKENCPWCSKGSNKNKYCPYCGRSTGRISEPLLSLTPFTPPVKNVEITEGGTFSIRFEHKSGVVVNIECDITNANNIAFKGKNSTDYKHQVQSSEKVDGIFEFCLKDYRKQPSGYITFKYDNAERDLNKIWKKKNIQQFKYSLNGKITTASSEWILGSEFLFFSNKLPKQNICIYNPSSIERDFLIESPNGYNVDSLDFAGMNSIPIEGYKNSILTVEKKKIKSDNPTYWRIASKDVELFELPLQKTDNHRKLKISFDLGARNFSIRAYWAGGNSFFLKKNGEIESIGEPSFSPTMVMDKTGKEFYFSKKAENVISRNKTINGCLSNNENLVPITGLKTSSRDFNDRYLKYNPVWTNEHLLSVLFSEVSTMIKSWVEELFFKVNKSIPNGFKFNYYFEKPEYIFTYPILETEEKTERYKKIFKNAFINSFNDETIDESQIKFISEPEAVFNYIASKKSDISLNSAGELFAVIDSGAGTTDFSIGKIVREKGTLSLKEIKSLCLDLTENQKAFYKINTSHLGGNLLDFILSYILDIDAKKLLISQNAKTYISLWNTLWGTSANEKFEDKMMYCKNIKERFEVKIANNEPVQLKVPNDMLTVNYKAYGENVIEPILKNIISEAQEKFASMGIDFRKIGTIVLVGGSNICRYMRSSSLSRLSINTESMKKDEQLTTEDRLYAIVEGAGIGVKQSTESAFATFTIKDEYNQIDEVIIREGEPITPISLQRSIAFDDSDTAILNLFAESELWSSSKKIASAIYKKSNSVSEDYGDEVIFEINLSNEKCVCNIYAGEYSGIGWDIQLA